MLYFMDDDSLGQGSALWEKGEKIGEPREPRGSLGRGKGDVSEENAPRATGEEQSNRFSLPANGRRFSSLIAAEECFARRNVCD